MSKDCYICKLPPGIVQGINACITRGDSIEQIGESFSLDPGYIDAHKEFCISDVSVETRYKVLISDVEVLLEQSKQATKDRPNSPGMYQSYVKLADIYRDLIKESVGLQSPETIIKDLVSAVINPLLQEMLREITVEMDLLKSSFTDAGVDRKKVDSISTDSFIRIGKRLNDLARVSLTNLNKYFGVKNTPVSSDSLKANTD